jgi:hypothetical protein
MAGKLPQPRLGPRNRSGRVPYVSDHKQGQHC